MLKIKKVARKLATYAVYADKTKLGTVVYSYDKQQWHAESNWTDFFDTKEAAANSLRK